MLNTITLMGRLTADPDYRTTQSGVAMVRFTLAVERDYQQGGEKQTDFIDIVAWRQTADFVSKYFHKGQLVAVQGSIQTDTYTDKDGNKRKSVYVQAQHVYFAESKKDNGSQLSGGNKNVNIACEPTTNNNFTPISDDDLPF